VVIILIAGLGAFVLDRRPRAGDLVFRYGIMTGCLAAAWPAIDLLGVTAASGASPSAPTTGLYGLDALSAWFLVIVLGVGGTTAIYGIPYLTSERGHRRVGGAHLLLAVLLVALAGVVTARTVIAFLAAWEVMAVSAYLLVVFEHEQADVRRAGLIYLVLTHASTIALMGMFAAWTGGLAESRFEDLAVAAGAPRPMGLILVLALVGFGIKAGVVPAHFWLPGAHAAAPSHVSALLSGVMLKTGIYGLLRVLTLVGAPPAWWGWVVLLLGLASAVLGVLWALAQHDLKRLLAYHSVENIGIILLGLGLGALGIAYRQPALALLGFTGALLHSLNHALFKSLLFLGAGAVVRATGTREIDRLGGLARVMPRTAAAFLVGSLAIVGLPPLNGFVSEWVIFQGLMQAGTTSGALRVASTTTAGLALTGALALACFTKLHGTVFHGTPRDTSVTPSGDPEKGLTAPQLVLAGACIAIGLLPVIVMPAVSRAAGVILGVGGAPGDLASAAAPAAAISFVALALAGLLAVLWVGRPAPAAHRSGPRIETWGCAYPRVTSRMQYSASGFAASLLALFGSLSGSRIEAGPGWFHTHPADPILDTLGRPLWERLVGRAASRLRVLQTGRLRLYLLYVIFCLLALLFYLWGMTAR
jgi:formate hydrogenlyase subunit 3/multisubunit Na+/H+ antiporter MnhD subunit